MRVVAEALTLYWCAFGIEDSTVNDGNLQTIASHSGRDIIRFPVKIEFAGRMLGDDAIVPRFDEQPTGSDRSAERVVVNGFRVDCNGGKPLFFVFFL